MSKNEMIIKQVKNDEPKNIEKSIIIISKYYFT
jgi:hypothetical protein